MYKIGREEHLQNIDMKKRKALFINGTIGYLANSVVSKTIIKSSTGNITLMSFDSGEGLVEKTSPFDSFSHVLEGKAEIVIDKVSHFLESGQGIIIPAYLPSFIRPNGRFKMMVTTIKT